MAETAKEGEAKTYPHLNDQNVADALKADKGPAAHLVSWQAKDFTKKGDNYACIVTSVVVQYTLDGVQQEHTYVTKLTRTFGPSAFSDMMNRVFLREGTCFLKILPEMNKILKQLAHPEIGVAKAYYCDYELGKEVLVVEDLRQRNFKMFDRKRGMDPPHARLVLRELGKLHAASLLLERSLPSHDITKTWDVFKDAWMEDKSLEDMFQAMISSQLEATAVIMEKVPNYEHVVKWLRESKDKAVNIYMGFLTTVYDNRVLNHGDCWNNNFLFRYNDAGDPVEVMLVDLQVMRKTTPALDLNYFLYSSFNGPDRKLNLEEFLKTYHTSFSSVLEAGEAPVPFTLEELRQDFRQHMIFGCLSGCLLMPAVLSEDKDVPNMDDILDGKLEEFAKERMTTVADMGQRKGSLLKPRLLDMFDEMTEAGVIS